MSHARERISSWIYEDDQSPTLNTTCAPFTTSKGVIRSYRYHDVNPGAFEVEVTDVQLDNSRLTTLVRIVQENKTLHVLVENGMESDDLAKRVKVGRPRIVHDLLQLLDHPRLGGSGIQSTPLEIPQNGVSILTELLASPARTVPMIVCTEPSNDPYQYWRRRADQIAKRTEGVATVVTFIQPAITEFRRDLGSNAAWDGRIRIYTPGVVNKTTDGWKHRYYLHSRIEEDRQKTIDKIVYSVTQFSTRRRTPAIFDLSPAPG